MGGKTAEEIHIGKVRIALETAVDWLRDYTDAENNKTRSSPYAYPAYDDYERDNNLPNQLTDADLLAPVLLNVGLSIRAFYGLQRIKPALNEGLASSHLQHPLADLDDLQIAATVRPLYGVLDDSQNRPRGVKATTLSKILHRKAPQCLVLHDKWVRACYVGDQAPVPRAKKRSWADYMTAITTAIANDIRDQPSEFAQLDAATDTPGRLSQVRLLDILAWKSQGNPSLAAY
ncbi:hypothetical protein EV138_4977 [Kribbella voronezhensis]|uniref:Uncharacterized protein n=1 Tax=Kribbella voronezhensis TaxID=2512212 RepID=A0A4R7TGH1_9ACTN|nr:DUF6308 family protein [Kribbella voronezhensis]TDU91371.1 hypothetical protein EV138_4977 [Kribbella voronezhensis]